MKIKICGLFRPEDIEYANEALPDYIGFVFAESRRRVTAAQAKTLKQKLDPGIQAVGVFVNAPLEAAARLLEEGIIDIAQLHGSEDEVYVERLKAQTQRQIIKAVRVRMVEDIAAAQSNPADFLLLDHGTGGTGESFDWSLVREFGKPFFLAGGIHADNIEQAMKAGRPAMVSGLPAIKSGIPYAIDVSSGAETDGVKDKGKILEIVRRVRNV